MSVTTRPSIDGSPRTRNEDEMSKRERDDEKEPRDRKPVRMIGVDGEGYDKPCGSCKGRAATADTRALAGCLSSDTPTVDECVSPHHLYIYIAAVDDEGVLVADAYDPQGLTHDACARVLLSLPQDALKFGFMFSYDVTKIIEQMPAIDRYYLVRPQLRDEASCMSCKKICGDKAQECPHCQGTELRRYSRAVRYRGRKYNFFNGSLSVQHTPTKRKVKIWDCFRFFGCAFVEAIKDWLLKAAKTSDPDWPYEEILDEKGRALCTRAQVERIAAMKGKRGSFTEAEAEEIKAYCREECHLLAIMMRRVKEAHERAGIPLKRYEGAGSTATALLTAHDVARYKGPKHKDLDPALGDAIARSFFGGRFEDSMVGIAVDSVFGFDISSAYPFALSGLPCLTCGSWRLERRATMEKLRRARLAVGAYVVREVSDRQRREIAWGPLPFRDPKGSISYGTNFRGWAWAPELIAALEGWPDLVVLTGDAWIYETDCQHAPFSFMPSGYRQRIAWGKEGAGKALKLGMNAAYGKCAQNLGDDPPFQSWVFAGMATSTCRGQLLEAIAGAKDRWNVLTVATDGIYSLEDLPLGSLADPADPKSWRPHPTARKTGTEDLPKPLGAWERKPIPEGVFVAKPGLYYKIGAAMADVRARGVGRKEVHSSMQKIMEGFLAWDREDMKHAVKLRSRRFYGAKHSIYVRSRCTRCKVSWPSVPEVGCLKCHAVGTDLQTSMIEDAEGAEVYGRWGERDIQIRFDPYPKRERTGISRRGESARLRIRDLGGGMSKAYDVGSHTTTPEGMLERVAKELQLDQPDWSEEVREIV